MRLETHHYIAINYLALPRRGGKTMQEIAEECQVSRQTVYKWLDNPVFAAELKRRIIRNSRDKLPDLVESMTEHAIADGNAALAKLVLQMNDMLTDAINVGDKLDSAGDIDAIQQRIKDFQDQQADDK